MIRFWTFDRREEAFRSHKMTSTLSHHHHNPHHHSHFAHHVRTRGWGIEPGWKFVNHESQRLHHIPVEFADPHLRRSFRSSRESPSIFSSYTKEPSVERYGSDGSRRSSSNSRAQSFRGDRPSNGSGRNIEIKFLDNHHQSHGHHHGGSSSRRSKTDEDCPVHQSQTIASMARSLGNGTSSLRGYSSSTLPRAHKPLPFPVNDHPKLTNSSSSSSTSSTSSFPGGYSSSSSTEPKTEYVPPGVLKKPGSYRGPKHMKKVAFLENAEFSRGIP